MIDFVRRRYGASPLHLLVFVASFALAGYAAWSLVHVRPVAVATWFVGAAVLHDLLVLPLYSIADRGVQLVGRRPDSPAPRALNYVRMPAALSALLLVVFLPSITRLSHRYHATTGLSSAGYFGRWLAITGVLFLGSAILYAASLRRAARHHDET